MKPIRHITAVEENFRTVRVAGMPGMEIIKRDPVKPVPEGTLILFAFRVVGYDPDCDGSLMARLEHITKDGETTGWAPKHLGLSPSATLVLDSADELRRLFEVQP